MAHAYTIKSIEPLPGSVILYTLEAASPANAFAFQAGQYAAISFQRAKRSTPARCFSIVSAPGEQPVIQFAIKTRGRYTSSMAQHAAVGDLVHVQGPFGDFTYNAVRDQAAVFLAGGIGIAPFMSMLRYAAANNLQNEIVLFYSCRTQNDIMFLNELTQLTAQNPHFHVIFAVSDGPTDILAGRYALQGHVTAEMIGRVIQNAFPLYSFFICGLDAYITSLREQLQHVGARPDFVFTEAFSQAKSAQKGWASWPRRVYALSAASLLLAPGAVLARDMFAKNNTISGNTKQAQSDAGGTSQVAPKLTLSAKSNTITTGESVEITWQASDTVQQCTASGGWQGILPISGSQKLSPTQTTTYTLTCSNQAGSQTKSVTVAVKQVSPVIQLSTNAPSVMAGNPVTINWQVAGTTPSCTAAGGSWQGAKEAVGTATDTPAATTTYTLTCSNQAGSQTKSVAVAVTPRPVQAGPARPIVPVPAPIPAPPPAPTPIAAPTLSFSAAAPAVTKGTGTTLSWSAGGSGVSCSGSGGWNKALMPSGSESTGPLYTTTTFTVTCKNGGGTVTKSVTITVNPASVGS